MNNYYSLLLTSFSIEKTRKTKKTSRIDEDLVNSNLKRGTTQSLKDFSLSLEDVSKFLQWKNEDISINDKRL